jgi:hypothetical protein
MCEIILIEQTSTTVFPGVPAGKQYFHACFLRIKSKLVLRQILEEGKAPSEFSNDDVAFKGDIPAPDGSLGGEGSSAIESRDEALKVALKARQNPRSALRAEGFSEQTPVYFWAFGQRAKILSGKAVNGG